MSDETDVDGLEKQIISCLFKFNSIIVPDWQFYACGSNNIIARWIQRGREIAPMIITGDSKLQTIQSSSTICV